MCVIYDGPHTHAHTEIAGGVIIALRPRSYQCQSRDRQTEREREGDSHSLVGKSAQDFYRKNIFIISIVNISI